jgi:hypothetical protein
VLRKPRKVKKLVERWIKVDVGAAKYVRKSANDLKVGFQGTEGWKAISEGQTMSLPVAEHIKKQHKLKVPDTVANMAKKLTKHYEELQKKYGLTAKDAEDFVKGESNATKRFSKTVGKQASKEIQGHHAKYQNYLNELCEITVKNAIANVLLGGYVMRGVTKQDVCKRNETLWKESGLSISSPNKFGEFDI